MTDSRPVVALYHHLPPGGAHRAMFELTRRTNQRYRYVLYEVEPTDQDPFASARLAPLADVVAEVHRHRAPVGGEGRIRRWTRAVPAIIKAERQIARQIEQLAASATVVHHQRFLQAPSLLRHLSGPSLYMAQEPRRRSFEYAIRHPTERGPLRRTAELPLDLLEGWARRQDLSATRAATAIVCNSHYSRETIWRGYGRDSTVLPLGADQDQFTLPPDDHREHEIVAVGALDDSKGHDLAIAAVGQLPLPDRPALRIIHNRAAPNQADKLRTLAKEHGVRLVLEADIDESTLVSRYQRASAVIATARVEPLGLTPLEAMACGTPVVAVNEGGYRETVTPGITGALADRSPEALAAGLHRVLSDLPGTDRSAIRQHARTSWNWDLASDRYAAELDRLIG